MLLPAALKRTRTRPSLCCSRNLNNPWMYTAHQKPTTFIVRQDMFNCQEMPLYVQRSGLFPAGMYSQHDFTDHILTAATPSARRNHHNWRGWKRGGRNHLRPNQYGNHSPSNRHNLHRSDSRCPTKTHSYHINICGYCFPSLSKRARLLICPK